MIDNRYLTDRHEIAYAMNTFKFPVLSLNRENRPYENSDFCTGCRCRVAWDDKNPRYADMATHGQVYMENGKYGISGEGACLSASFGYTDVMESLREANAPVVHKNQLVVLVEDFPSKEMCYVSVMKVSKWIDIHCSTVAHLEVLTTEEAAEWAENYKTWQRKNF